MLLLVSLAALVSIWWDVQRYWLRQGVLLVHTCECDPLEVAQELRTVV